MANHMESRVLKLFDPIEKFEGLSLLPLVGTGAVVGAVVEVVNRIPLGLIYSLAPVVLVGCEGGFVACSDCCCCCCSLPSITVVFVEGSFV